MVVESKIPVLTQTDIASLFEFLKHGSEDHQAWLWQAINAWAYGGDRPDVQD